MLPYTLQDGGCLMATPIIDLDCGCNPNPTVKKFAGCKDGNPFYFDDWNDIPNGVCIAFADG